MNKAISRNQFKNHFLKIGRLALSVKLTLCIPLIHPQEADPDSVQSGGGCTATGKSSNDPTLIALLALAMLGRKCNRVWATSNNSISKFPIVAVITVLGGLVTLLSPIDQVLAQSNDSATQASSLRTTPNALFGRRYYVGIGGGRSWLEPDTSEVAGMDTNKRSDSGVQISVGMDYSPRASFELHAAALGEAGLSSGEEIEYSHVGLSSLIYVGGARKRFNRQGFTGFARLGLGSVLNTADDNEPYSKDSDVQLTLGVGAEYALRFGLALRAETMTFDTDADYTQLGLIYRFGPAPEMPPEYVAPRAIHRDQDSQLALGGRLSQNLIPTLRPMLAVGPVAGESTDSDPDVDNDGVMNVNDACDSTLPEVMVDDVGCAVFDGVLEGVSFAAGSAQLTSESRNSLDVVAQMLSTRPSLKIELSAHTDNAGPAAQNDELSIERVKSVGVYLVGKGINITRLSLLAYGERRPIASNDTEQGRLTNRRVEIRSIR